MSPPRKRAKRKQAGRPPRGFSVVRSILQLEPDVKLALAHRAIDEGRDMSRIVNDALRKYLGLARSQR